MDDVPQPGLPFGNTALDLPREPFDLKEVRPLHDPPAALDDDAIGNALLEVVGSHSPKQVFRGAESVAIVVSDPTRSTGASVFLPHLLELIREAGVRSITFAIASGLHRTPTRDEVCEILGTEIAGRYPVIIHDPDDDSRLAALGRTSSGTPVKVNSALLTHDRTVLTGSVGFHYYAGFSGGRKAVVPGMASRETIVGNHLRAVRRDGSRHPRAMSGRLDGNPVHRDMVDGAAMLAPSFLVNTVMRPGGGIERIFSGHWRKAHVAACRYLRSTRSVRLEPRELVVVSAGGHPGDINLIQAHKAFEATIAALRPGGVLVLVAACGDGAGHDDFLPAFDQSSNEDLLALLMRDYNVYRQTALAWRRKLNGCRLILVSRMESAIVGKVGASPARDMKQAFEIALRWIPRGTPGWVFRQGARLLVQQRPAIRYKENRC